MNKLFWLLWLLITLAIGGFYGFKVFIDEDKEELLIGEATHGHFQIELSCSSCHTDAFGGGEVLQDACEGCHAQELEIAQDAHPRVKFADPRNAARLEGLDARYCVSCHTEHKAEQTHPMGLSLPEDYCYHCHQTIAEERPSHEGLAYDSCASAGCHNYHDNRALYENFLVDNADRPWLAEMARIAASDNAKITAVPDQPHHQLAFTDVAAEHSDIFTTWAASSHAEAQVNCGGCHSNESQTWIESPGVEQCATCHDYEAETFLAGKHGMRLAAGLLDAALNQEPAPESTTENEVSALIPEHSQLAFADGANAHTGCNNCHRPHEFDRQFAATEACLGCHVDEHSLAFNDSPHAQISNSLTNGSVEPESQVTCATCHMPRVDYKNSGTALALLSVSEADDLIRVNHNQNENLRPNEKMIRPVCMQCHSVEFAIDSLADPALIKNNFNGQPSTHIESIDWAIKNQSK